MEKSLLRVVGLMSGTSMDGIDGAILTTDGEAIIEMGPTASLSYDLDFHHALKRAEAAVREAQGDLKAAQKTCPDLPQIIKKLTDLHGDVVDELMQYGPIDLIGFHGQNLYHKPKIGITCQVGEPQVLAERFGVPVVFRFRQNDVDQGGQGAPFAPLYHQALAVSDGFAPCSIVNCGGISNVTFVNGMGFDNLMGFDTGPGNGLVDLYIKEKTHGRETYDADGRYGLKGQVNKKVLAALMGSLERFLEQSPPKSLDIGDFSYGSLLDDLTMEDAVRTLEELTVQCILAATRWLPQEWKIPEVWLLGGGGWKNPVIRESFVNQVRFQDPLMRVYDVDAVGWSNAGLEAQIFAYLAVRSLKGLPLSVPGVTGVSCPASGGETTYPVVKKTHFGAFC